MNLSEPLNNKGVDAVEDFHKGEKRLCVCVCVCVCVLEREYLKDFPGGPVVKMLHSQGRGCGLDSWLRN